jgi:hypothetical protein
MQVQWKMGMVAGRHHPIQEIVKADSAIGMRTFNIRLDGRVCFIGDLLHTILSLIDGVLCALPGVAY